MHNLSLAVLGYVTSNNAFPPAGVFGEDNSPATFLTDPSQGAITSWMPGRTAPIGQPMYSWVLPILPYMENQELFDQWSMFTTLPNGTPATVNYLDAGSASGGIANLAQGQASNLKIGNTSIGILKCPDDNTAQPNQGNLSYVVNGGFALYHANPIGWVGSAIDGGGTPSAPSIWSPLPPPNQIGATIGVTQKMGVFFLESTMPQGTQVRIPWNIKTSPGGIADGASSTIMLSENILAGESTGSPYSLNFPTNWACPLPTFTMFIGPTYVCGVPSAGTSLDCTTGTGPFSLAPLPGDIDGPGWAWANKVGSLENINGGSNLTIEGSFPFSNSLHPSGCNMAFCDGAVRFVKNTIDGTVYAKIITPAGSRLPIYAKQLPVNQDSFAP
jgi:prepilin-type processing-associated H-X9-DG protein